MDKSNVAITVESTPLEDIETGKKSNYIDILKQKYLKTIVQTKLMKQFKNQFQIKVLSFQTKTLPMSIFPIM